MHQLIIFLLSVIGFLILTIWSPIYAHMGMRDAFKYKKGNSRKKKEWKQLTRTQKALMLPVPTQFEIYAPFHLRVFRVLVVVYMIATLFGIVLIALVIWKCISIQDFYQHLKIRAFILELPFGIYCRMFWNRKKASYDFTDCKRP